MIWAVDPKNRKLIATCEDNREVQRTIPNGNGAAEQAMQNFADDIYAEDPNAVFVGDPPFVLRKLREIFLAKQGGG